MVNVASDGAQQSATEEGLGFELGLLGPTNIQRRYSYYYYPFAVRDEDFCNVYCAMLYTLLLLAKKA